MKVGDIQYTDAYGSHVILLAAAIARTADGQVQGQRGGPILEVGSGEFSTPLLNEVAAATGRTVVTVERDPRWAGRFRDITHELHLGDPHRPGHYLTSSLEHGLEACLYDVALVDGRALDRARAIEALREHCRYVIVHDTEPAQEGHYPGLVAALGLYRYRYDYKRGEPWTTVVSDKGPW